MIDLGQLTEPAGDLQPARRDLPEYRQVREVERRASVSRGDDPALLAKKERLAAFLARGQQPDPDSPRGALFDAEV